MFKILIHHAVVYHWDIYGEISQFSSLNDPPYPLPFPLIYLSGTLFIIYISTLKKSPLEFADPYGTSL